MHGSRVLEGSCTRTVESSTSWAFTQKSRSAGLLPSFGTVGDGLDDAMMESFWSTFWLVDILEARDRELEPSRRSGHADTYLRISPLDRVTWWNTRRLP